MVADRPGPGRAGRADGDPGMPLPAVAALLVALTCPQPPVLPAPATHPPRHPDGDRFPVGMDRHHHRLPRPRSPDSPPAACWSRPGRTHPALGHRCRHLPRLSRLLAGHRPAPPAAPATHPASRPPALVSRGSSGIAGSPGLPRCCGCTLLSRANGPWPRPTPTRSGAGKAVVGVADGAARPARRSTRRPARGRMARPPVPADVPLAISPGCCRSLGHRHGPARATTVLLWAASARSPATWCWPRFALTRAVPDHLRARTIGVAAAGLRPPGPRVLLAGALA